MPSPATPPATPDAPAAEAAIQSAAEVAALRLAAEAGALDLAAAAADPESESDILATLLAHELATGHRLMMRLAARAETFLDHAAAEAQSPDERSPDERSSDERRAGLEAARLAGAAGRLMERYRLGLLALRKLRAPGPDGGPEQRVRLVWAGGLPGEDGPPDDGPGPGPGPGAGGGVPPAAPPHPGGSRPGGLHRRGRLRNGNPPGDYAAAPRCGARTRAGGGCRQPAMANGRCRLHGGKSTGPRSAAGLYRCRTARLRHGARSVELATLRRAAAASARRLRLLSAVGDGVGQGAGRRIPAGHGVHRPDFAPRGFAPERSVLPMVTFRLQARTKRVQCSGLHRAPCYEIREALGHVAISTAPRR